MNSTPPHCFGCEEQGPRPGRSAPSPEPRGVTDFELLGNRSTVAFWRRPRTGWIAASAPLLVVGTVTLRSALRATAAYSALFVWSFLAATLIPLSSEAPLAAIVYHRRVWLIPVIVATVGNYLGACTTYGIARWATSAAGFGNPNAHRHRTAVGLVARYGAPVMLLSWVPIIGDALVAVAGAVAMPFVRFSIAVSVGKAARYAIVAWLALKI